ncbi:ribosomal-processing cysteine protease Prp [Candidatus Riflebacteria bacterium]
MIQIIWLKSKGGEKGDIHPNLEFFRDLNFITGIRVLGHAGFDIIGNDIVCAGFSTLFFTMLAMVEKKGRTQDHATGPKFMEEIQVFQSILKPGVQQELALHWEMFIEGINLLLKNYPESFNEEIHLL